MNTMKIPQYIQNMLKRAEYTYSVIAEPGYTIRISKESHYTQAGTFRAEINRLCNWVNRQPGGEAHLLDCPTTTSHKQMQYATVTIYDPIMKHLEKFIEAR